MEKYINIGNGKKVSNPCFQPGENDEVFHGNVLDYSFVCQGLNQLENYHKIKDDFDRLNLQMESVWSKKIYCNNQPLIKFLVKVQDRDIFWYKYEGSQPGGGNNMIIINGTKIKLSLWFEKTDEEKANLVNY